MSPLEGLRSPAAAAKCFQSEQRGPAQGGLTPLH